MWVSLCAGQVLFDTVYLLVEWTCASTKCKTGQEVSSAKRLAVLVQDASMRGAVVNRVCTRQRTRHGQWLCNEKAIAVLARRRSEILESCGNPASCFRFISFAENTSAALAPRAGNSQPIFLLFFLFSCSWICPQKVASDFYYSVSKFSGVRKKTELTLKRLFSNVSKYLTNFRFEFWTFEATFFAEGLEE